MAEEIIINLKSKEENREWATVSEMLAQIYEKYEKPPENLVIRFSDDPGCNPNVIMFLIKMEKRYPRPIFITCFPKSIRNLNLFMNSIVNMINESYPEGFLFGMLLESTSEKQRKTKLHSVYTLQEISKAFEKVPKCTVKPVIILDTEYDLDANKLANLFNPEDFAVKIKKTEKDISETKLLFFSQGFKVL